MSSSGNMKVNRIGLKFSYTLKSNGDILQLGFKSSFQYNSIDIILILLSCSILANKEIIREKSQVKIFAKKIRLLKLKEQGFD